MTVSTTQTNEANLTTWQENFLPMLPTTEQHARFAFRDLDPESREEAVQEAVANATVAYKRLHDRGELQCVFATALAKFAVAQYRDGRRVGTPENSRDLFSPKAQRRGGFTISSLNTANHDAEVCIDCVVDRRRTPVADQVAFRLDFPRWFAGQSNRNRQIINRLSQNYATSEVAREFQVTPARVSQLRRELADSWQEFNSVRRNGPDPGPIHYRQSTNQHVGDLQCSN
jgi:hypothetical protein